jgi:hypothetical protein
VKGSCVRAQAVLCDNSCSNELQTLVAQALGAVRDQRDGEDMGVKGILGNFEAMASYNQRSAVADILTPDGVSAHCQGSVQTVFHLTLSS